MAKEGRPLTFKSVNELEEKIREYFDSCFEHKWFDEDARDANGKVMFEDTVGTESGIGKVMRTHTRKLVQIEPVTVTGLAYALGCDRKTLLNYEDKDEYFLTIKKAKQFIESLTEKGLLSGKINPAAGIFNLKNNWGWKDEIHNTITPAELSKEEQKKMDELLSGKKPEKICGVELQNKNPESKEVFHCPNMKPCADHDLKVLPAAEKSNESNQSSGTGSGDKGNEGAAAIPL